MTDYADERWLLIKGYEGLYEVSDYGRIRCQDGMIMKTREQRGYRRVGLYKARETRVISVAATVLTAFVGDRPLGNHACHLDGTRDNDRLCNLMWGTPKENESHKVIHGTKAIGSRHGRSIRTEKEAAEIKALHAFGLKSKRIAEIYSTDRDTITAISRGHLWAHVNCDLSLLENIVPGLVRAALQQGDKK